MKQTCRVCGGAGYLEVKTSTPTSIEPKISEVECETCHGTGFIEVPEPTDQDKLVAALHNELAEAEAERDKAEVERDYILSALQNLLKAFGKDF